MKSGRFFSLILLVIICGAMSEEYSKSLGFGYPNEFYECHDEKTKKRSWMLSKPEEIIFAEKGGMK